jgi:hypothetical protein
VLAIARKRGEENSQNYIDVAGQNPLPPPDLRIQYVPNVHFAVDISLYGCMLRNWPHHNEAQRGEERSHGHERGTSAVPEVEIGEKLLDLFYVFDALASFVQGDCNDEGDSCSGRFPWKGKEEGEISSSPA